MKLKRGQLAVIRDKVTREEISEVILNPRKRETVGLPAYPQGVSNSERTQACDRKH